MTATDSPHQHPSTTARRRLDGNTAPHRSPNGATGGGHPTVADAPGHPRSRRHPSRLLYGFHDSGGVWIPYLEVR